MARALRLADRGRFWARPNPHVGCVLAHGDRIVGEGFTQPAGSAHAEVRALQAAGDGAHGATAYVTLEPCSHHGRTPPCADALIAAGVARVVVAVEDPNPRVAGNGIRRLRDAGIIVETGLQAAAVERQLAGFLARHRRGRGRLRLKVATSLDGRTAMASGESQWITGPAARADVQHLRAESCAVLTGSGTVLADDCALTVRDEYFSGHERLPPAQRRALRVIADSQLQTRADAAVLRGEQPSLVLHRPDMPVPGFLTDRAVAVPAGDTGLDPAAMLEVLARRECNEILLESGPALAGAFMQTGLVDELIVYQAPKLLGSRGRPMFDLPLDRMAEAWDLELIDERRLGPDLRLTLRPQTGD